jgi:hypothetical protein
MSKTTHGGKRPGAGRKPALLPFFTKKMRATEGERKEFMSRLSADAREDFLTLLYALRKYQRWLETLK